MPFRSMTSRLKNVLLESSGSQNVILRRITSQSTRNFLEKQILRSCPRPAESAPAGGDQPSEFQQMLLHSCLGMTVQKFILLRNKMLPALRKEQANKTRSQELKQNRAFLEAVQNTLLWKTHARIIED